MRHALLPLFLWNFQRKTPVLVRIKAAAERAALHMKNEPSMDWGISPKRAVADLPSASSKSRACAGEKGKIETV